MQKAIPDWSDKCLFLLLLIAIFMTACAHRRFYESATVAFNSGDYDGAVYNSVEALKNKPDYPEAIALLRNSVTPAYEYHIRVAKRNEDAHDFDRAIAEYKSIERLIEAVSSVRRDIILDDVSEKKRIASDNAAEAHYNRGRTLLQEGEENHDRNKLIAAAIEFRTAQEFVPGYKYSQSLYERARKGGVTRIAVLPFQDANVFTDYRGALADQIIAAAMKKNTEFIDFITREHLGKIEKEKAIYQLGIVDSKTAIEMGKALGVHYIVTGKVISAVIDGPKRTDAKGSNSCRVREKKDQYRDGYAIWTTYELKSTAVVSASFQVIDVKTGQIIGADTVRPEETDVARWKEFKGDEDCLPWEIRHFSNGKTTVDGGPVLQGRAFEKASEEIALKLLERSK
ncbi:MAG: hypothetical protein HZA14_13070 [Nitrospirae bacterium]|nr:hypothetical protein [Nitrospirota bacterium]